MHDEVSETENIRKNLAIERMIVEGCEILLDTSQTFVRQGNIILVCWKAKVKYSIPKDHKGISVNFTLDLGLRIWGFWVHTYINGV